MIILAKAIQWNRRHQDFYNQDYDRMLDDHQNHFS